MVLMGFDGLYHIDVWFYQSLLVKYLLLSLCSLFTLIRNVPDLSFIKISVIIG